MFKTLNLNAISGDKSKFQAIQEWIAATVNWQQPDTLTDGATVTWYCNRAYNTSVTLAGSRTLIVAGAKPGSYGTIEIVQGGSGSYTLTLPSGSKVANAGTGAITLSTAVGAIDVASFYYDGVNYFWTISLDFT